MEKVLAGPGAYTPKTPESSHKKHRTPDLNNPSAAGAIAALQAKLRSTRRAATGEAHLVDEVLRATLKFGTVQVLSSPKPNLRAILTSY